MHGKYFCCTLQHYFRIKSVAEQLFFCDEIFSWNICKPPVLSTVRHAVDRFVKTCVTFISRIPFFAHLTPTRFQLIHEKRNSISLKMIQIISHKSYYIKMHLERRPPLSKEVGRHLQIAYTQCVLHTIHIHAHAHAQAHRSCLLWYAVRRYLKHLNEVICS